MGREIGGRRETDAVLEVRKKKVQFESVSADETTGVFGAGEMKAIRGRVRCCRAAAVTLVNFEAPGISTHWCVLVGYSSDSSQNS